MPDGSGRTGGETTGTVRHWSDETGSGVVDAPELPGGCGVDAAVVEAGPLRAGQPVRLRWETTGDAGRRVTRVVPDEELGMTPGA